MKRIEFISEMNGSVIFASISQNGFYVDPHSLQVTASQNPAFMTAEKPKLISVTKQAYISYLPTCENEYFDSIEWHNHYILKNIKQA